MFVLAMTKMAAIIVVIVIDINHFPLDRTTSFLGWVAIAARRASQAAADNRAVAAADRRTYRGATAAAERTAQHRATVDVNGINRRGQNGQHQ